MPELPEVETIKRQLEQKICGKKIKKVEIKLPRIINIEKNQFRLTPRRPSGLLGLFEKTVTGSAITNVKRRAKLLIINLSNNWSLAIHLKLTGQLTYKSGVKNSPLAKGVRGLSSCQMSDVDKHTHVIFHFTDGSQLLYNDLRQFGYIKLIETKKIPEFLAKENFGPEPLEKDFTLDIFKNLLSPNNPLVLNSPLLRGVGGCKGEFRRSRQKIKPLLMDQTFLAGIGNIYAQEICFYAKVAPTRIVSTLSDKEISEIYDGIKKILLAAITHKGSSVDTYVDIYGLKGEYIPFLKVYGREGKECFHCGAKIKMIRLAGRGTCFCPKCQR